MGITLTHSPTDNRIIPDCNIKINPDLYFCNQLNKIIYKNTGVPAIQRKDNMLYC